MVKSKSEAVIVNHDFSNDNLDKTLIRVDNPVYAYIQILELLTIQKNIIQVFILAIISKNLRLIIMSIGPYVGIDENT